MKKITDYGIQILESLFLIFQTSRSHAPAWECSTDALRRSRNDIARDKSRHIDRHRIADYRLQILTFLLVFFLTITNSYAQLFPVLGGQRAGISALQFLKIGAGARAIGMGESFVAVANDASSLFYNPAGAVQSPSHQIHFSHTEWLVDLQHEFGAAIYKLSASDAVGVSVISLHTDDMKVTTETQPFGTGQYFQYGDFAIGATYSRRFTEQFSFGITVKYVEESLAELKMRGVMVDLGTYYWTGLGSTRFAVAVTNFGSQVSPSGSVRNLRGETIDAFQEFSPPTQFRIGFAFEPVQEEMHRLTTSIQLNHPNDNSENVGLGVEYAWNNMLFARAGYKFNVDEESFSAGAGFVAPVSFTTIQADYAFADFGRIGGVHRISMTIGF